MQSDSSRFREMVSVLGTYGFGEIRHKFKKRETDNRPLALRQAFEELGPSFIKIGQILSTRSDLLSAEYLSELQKLQENTLPLSFEVIQDQYFSESGHLFDEDFAYVNPEPLASASIAQVHEAKLKTGEHVVIKIQRPEIEAQLIRDINIFIRVVEAVPSIFMDVIVNPVEILKDIKRQVMEEIDFVNEAHNMLRFSENHRNRTTIQSPLPYLPLTNKRVLVQDYEAGISIGRLHALKQEAYDLDDIAYKLVLSYLYQVFEDGFYHADPHPGNIMIQDGRIIFIDFGAMGKVSSSEKKILLQILSALVAKDIDHLVNLLLQICKQNKPLDKVLLYRDIDDLFDRYFTAGMEALNIDAIFQDLLKFGHRHGLTFPSEYIMLEKTVAMVQGVAQNLSPSLDFMQIFQSFFLSSGAISWEKYIDPSLLARETFRSVNTVRRLPSKLEAMVDNINNGRLNVRITFENIDERLRDINSMINRVIFGVILSSLILASTFIITSAQTYYAEILGMAFFIVTAVIGLILLISMLRARRK
ncbi:AarF/ABC1/UbiB kinase family protein [Aerococcus agrisoli]|uniref:AarF/ABC1/UbiB kinase family protein n=1 Tax=Aerococcus agrisoli TaxID=2487350 RepID=A0A3N4G3U1_9LACT|nr:AarF/UbiB family protein [Aerococcus agrisoli]RPA57035.1 AarF/ABC1/UbiB kinase family protein [Aerococcus agrisoli]